MMQQAERREDRATGAAELARLDAMIATDTRQALAEARAALARIDKAERPWRAAALMTLNGRILGLLDAHDEARSMLTEAIALFRGIGDSAGLAEAMQELGTSSFRRGDLAEALDRVEESYRMARDAGERRVALRALNRMAAVYSTLRDYTEAIRLYRQALAEGEAMGTLPELVAPACNLAQTYIIKVWESDPGTDNTADIDAAWTCIERARSALTDTRPSPYRMAVFNVLAQGQNLRGDSAAAIETATILIAEAKSLAIVSMEACGHRELASAYLDQGRHDEAAAEAQIAIDLFRSIQFVHETTFPLKTLALAEEGRGAFAAALTAQRAYQDTRWRVTREAAERHATFLKTRNELERVQREAAMQRRLAGELETKNRALSEATEAAEAARDAKGAFLSMMGHELRSPLQAILGFSELIATRLGGDPATASLTGAARDIHHAGEHLLRLINQILDYSKGEIGKLRLEEDTAQLSQIVKSALKLVADRARRSGVRLVNAMRDDLYLRVDELKLTQCLLNMLSNAVKFTPEGGEVGIAMRLEPDWVVLLVRDNGIGIASEDIPKVFEPFGQGRNAAGREGTGLGVPLSKMLIELHGGTLTIDSKLGNGTVVAMRLPRSRITELPDETAAA